METSRPYEQKKAGQEECLVCFNSLNGGQGFAQVLHQGDMARFCSMECLEIFQNNPASFLRRMNPLPKTANGVEHLLDESMTDPLQGRARDA